MRGSVVLITVGYRSAYEIDPAELFRVFLPKLSATVEGERSETHREHLLLDDAHQREILLLLEQLDEVRTDRDAWREQAQRLALVAPETVSASVATSSDMTAPKYLAVCRESLGS